MRISLPFCVQNRIDPVAGGKANLFTVHILTRKREKSKGYSRQNIFLGNTAQFACVLIFQGIEQIRVDNKRKNAIINNCS